MHATDLTAMVGTVEVEQRFVKAVWKTLPLRDMLHERGGVLWK
jgi:hypothetical protein